MPEKHSLDILVRRLISRGPLDSDDRQGLLDLPHHVRTLEPASYTVREGDLPRSCEVLMSGFAFRQKTTGDGARQIIHLHVPGDIVDLQNLFLNVADHNVQILSRAQVAFIPRPALQQLALTRPNVGHALLVEALIEASITREWVVNVGRRDARARLAHMLCEFSLRLETAGLTDDGGYSLPMTQEQLADSLGLTSVHVNRTIKSLEADDLIRREKRRILIPDWKRMRDVADFNARYLHLDQTDSANYP